MDCDCSIYKSFSETEGFSLAVHKQNISHTYFLKSSVSLFIFHKVNPPTLDLFSIWDDFVPLPGLG
jgi:hypothetical protein